MPTRRFVSTSADGNVATHVGDDPSDVERNRVHLARVFGVQRSNLRFMDQVHGNSVTVATATDHRVAQADGIITRERELALVVLTADCVPVLLSSPEVVGAVHVGRKGLVNGVALRAIEQMRVLGATTISAFLGPAICGSCYEVPPQMQREVAEVAPGSLSRTPSGHAALDIRAGLASLLWQERVAVEIDSRCTKESADLFSYRRDPRCGRFASAIMLV